MLRSYSRLLRRCIPLVLVSMVPLGISAETLYEGAPGPSLLSSADRVIVSTSHTAIERQVPLRARDRDVFLIAVPTGELSAELVELTVRHLDTGSELVLLREGKKVEEDFPIERIHRSVKVEEFGRFRRTRVAALSVGPFTAQTWEGKRWEVSSYRVRVSYPETEPTIVLKHEELFDELLDAALLAPEAAKLFRLPAEDSPFPGPAEWFPLPSVREGTQWLKVPIVADDVYTIDGRWIAEAGLDVNEVSPRELVLLREGVVVPTTLIGGGSFATGARLVFHAEGNDSPETAKRVIWAGVAPEGLEQVAMESGPALSAESPEMIQFLRTHRQEEDNQLLTSMGAFLSIRDMTWVWGKLSDEEPLVARFDVPGIVTADADAVATATLRLYSENPGQNASQEIVVSHGGEPIAEFGFDSRSQSHSFTLPADQLRPSGNELTIRLGETTRPVDLHLDAIEIEYESFLRGEDGRLPMAIREDFPDPGVRRLRATNLRAPIGFDLTEPANPRLLDVLAGRGIAHFSADIRGGAEIVVLSEGALTRAPAPVAATGSDWSHRRHSADVLVIHHEKFSEAAELLAEDLRAQGNEVLCIDVAGIYEAFSGGNLSTDAIRNFLAYAVNEWEGRRPQAVVLIGDSTSDGRGIARNGVENYLPIPLWSAARGRDSSQQFASDSVYTWLSGDDEAADILLGRYSPSTPEEALAAVRNTIAYRAAREEPADWAGGVLAVIDTGNFESTVIEMVRRSIAEPYRTEILSADRFAWEDNYFLPPSLIRRVEDSKVSPLLTAEIERSLNAGKSIVTFFGHGAPNLWSNQRFWFGGGTPNSDILRLQNGGKLPLVTSFTCNNAVVDYPLKPWNICLAEDFMRHEGKGAIGCFMPSGPGYLSNHSILADGFFRAATTLGVRHMGVLAELSRINYQALRAVDDHSRMFILLGDPTLRLVDPSAPPEWTTEFPTGPRAPVVLEELNSLGADGWSLVLHNRENEERAARLIVESTRASGEVLPVYTGEPSIGGGARVLLTVPAEGHTSHTARLKFRLDQESPLSIRRGEPVIAMEDLVIAADAGGDPFVFVPDTALEAPAAKGSDPILRATIVNPTNSMVARMVEGTVLMGGEERGTFSVSFPSIPALGSVTMSQPIPVPVIPENPIEVRLALRTPEPEGVVGEEVSWTVTPKDLPDLTILPESVRTAPDLLSDGLTIFVDAELENRGGSASPGFQAVLQRTKEDGTRETLRSIAHPRPFEIGSMEPGDRFPIRLRWDPSNNAGSYDLFLVLDPEERVLESDRSNNELRIPVEVRSKSKLVVGQIGARLLGENRVMLIGPVGNTGGTDAQRVAVSFYKGPQQTPENLLGEVVLNRVPAGQTINAEFEWTLEPPLTPETIQPSYSVALKGSLMRMSSVADTGEGDAP